MRALPPLFDWLTLEHQVAQILTQQELHGWYFNQEEAYKLESKLRIEIEKLSKLLRDKYPFVAGSLFTPKRNNSTQGYVEGCEIQRIKELNPTSRDHIAWILKTHENWRPKSQTISGKAVIDETVLKDIGSETALLFLQCLDITKKLGMISEGVNAWLKLCTMSNRIHHHCSVATNTFRCAHRKPNLGQVPADEQFRRLFTATPGKVMVGADLSGIELRMLAHYLGRYDGGRYADILLNGDIHQVNADKIGISRRQVKTVTYAFLYGAGNLKLGLSFDPQLSQSKAAKKGKEIREAYVDAIDGLGELLKAVNTKSKQGYLKAIDSRKVLVDSPHKGLNYLLQCGAGVIAKRWMVIANDRLQNTHTNQLAFIHDELQYECDPKYTEEVKTTLEDSAVKAGVYYKLRCPIAAESKSGTNWSEVH